MKTLEKAEMLERNKVMRVLTEARILATVDHPFLASLYGTIVTDTHLHFLMQARAHAATQPHCPGQRPLIAITVLLSSCTILVSLLRVCNDCKKTQSPFYILCDCLTWLFVWARCSCARAASCTRC